MLTWLEIDTQAIKHNLKEFRRHLGRKILLMPVIKANAYGHGFLGVAKLLDQSREVDRLCVVSLDEALKLIKNKITKPVLILSFYDLEIKKLLPAVKNEIIFPLYNLEQAKILNAVGERAGKIVKVHLKVDTGAARIGLAPGEVIKFVNQIKKYRHIKITGLFSHFASSEDDRGYTLRQIKVFNKIYRDLRQTGINIKEQHLACSAASLLYPTANFNAVRLGLSLYGLYPNPKSKTKIKLRPALSWYAKIVQIKQIPKGARIGYGGTFITTKPTTLAVIPVGYFDGYDRRFSNKAQVLIKGQKCPIRGRICMNLSMMDITGLKGVKQGDKAVLIGQIKLNSVSVDNLAKIARTINYEIVDRINPLLPRIYI